MPFWTLFWLIAPAGVLLAIGTWLHLRGQGQGRDRVQAESEGKGGSKGDPR